MKKIIIGIFLIGLILFSGFYAYYSHYYNENMKIISLAPETILLEDSTGNLWKYDIKPGDSFKKGQVFNAKIFDNNTPKIEDDIIIEVSPNDK